MDETIEIKVTSDLAGKRLDVILAEQCDDLTRSYINKLCKEERAKLNDKISKGNKKCKEGDKEKEQTLFYKVEMNRIRVEDFSDENDNSCSRQMLKDNDLTAVYFFDQTLLK